MRVVLVEDSTLLREGLSRVLAELGHTVAATASSADTGLAAILAHLPEVAVVDVRLPPDHSDDGVRLAIDARNAIPNLPILLLSQYVESTYLSQLLSVGAGAIGYLLKQRIQDLDALDAALHQVGSGGTVLDPEVVAQLLAQRHSGAPLDRLTPREREVLALMAEGRSNRALADALTISTGAVEKHVASIFTKLDLPVSRDEHRRVLAVLTYLDLAGKNNSLPWTTPGQDR